MRRVDLFGRMVVVIALGALVSACSSDRPGDERIDVGDHVERIAGSV
jgi:hypothetical protein